MQKNINAVEKVEDGIGDNLAAAAEAACKVLSEHTNPFNNGHQTMEEYVTNDVTKEQLLAGKAKEITEELFNQSKLSELAIIPGIITGAIDACQKGQEWMYFREDNVIQSLQQVLHESTSEIKSDAMIQFIRIVKDTDAARELNRAFKVADVLALSLIHI